MDGGISIDWGCPFVSSTFFCFWYWLCTNLDFAYIYVYWVLLCLKYSCTLLLSTHTYSLENCHAVTICCCPPSRHLSKFQRGLYTSPTQLKISSLPPPTLKIHTNAFPNTHTHRPPRPKTPVTPPHKHISRPRRLPLPLQHPELESKSSI